MVRVLHAVPNMDSGGIENYIMNMYRNVDRDRVQFDFLVHHARRAFFDDEIEALGGRIFRLPVLDNKNVAAYLRDLRALFAQGEWRVVHGHAASLAYLYLGVARRSGVPVRIAHSHGTSYLRTPKGYAKRLLFKGAKVHANVRWACSTEAGSYLFGSRDFTVVPNAVSTTRFAYNEALREAARRELGLEPRDLLLGHVGRYNLQKNHVFLVDVFAEVRRREPRAKLLLVGAGELEGSVRAKVGALGLNDAVLFRSVTSEPESLYAAMDRFVLPSLYEGLPLVGVEAQCSGLPCLFASTVTRELAVTELASYLDLARGPAVWADALLDARVSRDRASYARCVADAGYDCVENARAMTACYERLHERGVVDECCRIG